MRAGLLMVPTEPHAETSRILELVALLGPDLVVAGVAAAVEQLSAVEQDEERALALGHVGAHLSALAEQLTDLLCTD